MISWLDGKVWRDGYDAERAQHLTERRHARGRKHKLEYDKKLCEEVRNYLELGWSPEQISGRLEKKFGKQIISYESIYRYIYFRSAQKDYWHKLLPRKKSKRGKVGKKGGSPASFIKERVSITERPDELASSSSPGNWEADLMLFSKYKQAVLVAHEKASRYLMIVQQPNKTSQLVLDNLNNFFEPLPNGLRKSVTFDNGTEFALHYMLKHKLNIQTFFCEPHKPWQKGGVENSIGRLRRRLPRKTDLTTISSQQIKSLADNYNNTPRKCLNFLTPNEVMNYNLTTVALQT